MYQDLRSLVMLLCTLTAVGAIAVGGSASADLAKRQPVYFKAAQEAPQVKPKKIVLNGPTFVAYGLPMPWQGWGAGSTKGHRIIKHETRKPSCGSGNFAKSKGKVRLSDI